MSPIHVESETLVSQIIAASLYYFIFENYYRYVGQEKGFSKKKVDI
jgi:hypothetical protein